jgi:[protein-PII] uridylyltransferase
VSEDAGTRSRSTILLPAPGSAGGKLSEIARDYMASVRDELAESHWAGAPGIETCHRLATCIDNLIRFVFESATDRFSKKYARTRQQCAVIALGGYGRREQAPHSDVDLLVLHSGRVTPYVETVTESLLYTLWDARLDVGHAVRSVNDCVALARTDLTIKTSLLDGRFLCGSPELAGVYETEVRQAIAAEDVVGFTVAKVAEMRSRHARLGESVFILEPNLKEGQGGLRDLHFARWIGMVMRGAETLEDFADADILTTREFEELSAALEFLFHTRNGLHFLAGGKGDQLTFERGELLAERGGYKAEGSASPGDLLLRDYHHHAALVARTTLDVVQRLMAPPEKAGILDRFTRRTIRAGVTVSGNELLVDDAHLGEAPENLIRVFADAQRLDAEFSPAAREAIRRAADGVTPQALATTDCVDVFFSILRAKSGVFRILAAMNRLGVLGKLIPEFGRLFCMVQHDYYHVYTVDEHSLIGIRELEKLRDGEFARDSPFLTNIMRQCDAPELLYLGMMFHDLGKGFGGDHDEKGALMVREIAVRLFMHEDHRETLEFLVRNHLLMSDTAQRHDIEDPKIVLDFVHAVGTAQRLRLLYLLTFADMKAVGPKIWNGWRDHLLAELYRRAVDMFDRGIVTEADIDKRSGRTRERLIERGEGVSDRRQLAEFLESMPSSYLVGTTDDQIIDHWRLYQSVDAALFRSGVVHHPERGFTEFTICAPDKRGLFSSVTAALSVAGLSIVAARLATSSHGWAIDIFRIDHAGGEADALSPEVWGQVTRNLELIFSGECSASELVEQSLAERGQRLGDKAPPPRGYVRVEVDNETVADFTALDVYAADRPVLLFLISDAMYRHGLSVHMAKISTHVTEVLDVFYVTDADGNKIEDPEIARTIAAAIEDALDPARRETSASDPPSVPVQ